MAWFAEVLHRRSSARRVGQIAAGAGTLAAIAIAAQRARQSPTDWVPGGGAIHEGTLVARVVGVGPPMAVLLHGLGASNQYWGAAYDPLAQTGSLIVPDLLGFGRSPRPAHGYGPEAHADALAACLAELGADRPMIVGAHSLGCVIALALAARHPKLVGAVVGFGPPLYPDRATGQERIAHLGFIERQLAYGLPFAEMSCQWMCNHRTAAARIASVLRPGIPRPILRDGVQHSWASYSQSFYDVLLAVPGDALLERICVPVTLVAGLDDQVPDQAHLRTIAARHSYVHVVERDGDHDLPLTDPTWCMNKIRLAGAGGGKWL